jgi:hypothetical protein
LEFFRNEYSSTASRLRHIFEHTQASIAQSYSQSPPAVVFREQEAPHFETMLGVGVK